MKKVASFLIVLVLAFSISIASAADFSGYSLDELLKLRDELGQAIHNARVEKAKSLPGPTPHEGEITFRDLHWGDSYTTVQDKYQKISNGYSSAYPEPAYVWAGGSKKYKYENGNLTTSCSCYSDYTVAGYDASLNFLFAYTVTDPIKRELENTMLIGAQYNISSLSDPDGVANDLIEKLSSVYGDYSNTSTGSTLGGYSLYYYYWTGANDTFIILKEMNGGKADANSVTISYGWNGSDDYINAFDSAVSAETAADEATRFGDGNTDGL